MKLAFAVVFCGLLIYLLIGGTKDAVTSALCLEHGYPRSRTTLFLDNYCVTDWRAVKLEDVLDETKRVSGISTPVPCPRNDLRVPVRPRERTTVPGRKQ